MKNSINYLKAGRIATKLYQIFRIEVTPENILSKIRSQKELDFYYTRLWVRP